MFSLIFAIQTLAFVASFGLYLWSLRTSGAGKKAAKLIGITLAGLIAFGMLCTTYKAVRECVMRYQLQRQMQDYSRDYPTPPQFRNQMDNQPPHEMMRPQHGETSAPLNPVSPPKPDRGF